MNLADEEPGPDACDGAAAAGGRLADEGVGETIFALIRAAFSCSTSFFHFETISVARWPMSLLGLLRSLLTISPAFVS